MKGEIGSKLRDGQTLQNAAKIDAETKIVATQRQGDGKKEEIRVKTDVKVYENQREAEVAEANSELAKKKAGWAKEAQVESLKAVVERMNAFTRTEKLRAEFLSKASVEYGKKEEIRVKTDVKVYENQREAEVAEAANAELAKKKAGWAKEAQVESLKAVVERMNAFTRTEKLRAEFLSKASVEYGKKEEIRVKTDVKVYENQREAEVAEANAELAKKKAGWAKEAQVESLKAVVERMNAFTRTEKLRAEFLSKASVEYETKVQGVRSKLGSKEAVAQKAMAEAAFYTGQQGADGELNAKQKEAEGLVALAKAQGAWTNDKGGSGAMDGAACSGSSALKEVAGMLPPPILVSITVKPKFIFNNNNNNNNNITNKNNNG
ncbi:hypothetical protein Q3G72_020223 [Acer saccharum]|nr:hypothetical protein Q3G72_020223 [Acer saccharum]